MVDIEKLLTAGGKRWQKNGMDRIYFDTCAEMIGLELDRYNTGNISSAKLDGEKISNTQAKKIIGSISVAKIWFDIADQKWHGQNCGEYFSQMVNWIKSKL